ncbi:hypothetical protein BDN72DRAFT_818002 [Pluteus cervinus]|uniref:Uncharacterized protein n=1 Tax=Pluteus cervinus TaxID=181527 RepID=A0ACD3AYW9_9AGAR|nr:hypothetical protein BDN72DRAFT_818002 [Pluteus cervinus]
MGDNPFSTPVNRFTHAASSLRATATKRDSLAAELERDPQLTSAKRQQRAQVFTSTMAHASLERQLVAAQTLKLELETKLREREIQVERLERDRRWLTDREKEEKDEKERERVEHEEEKRRLETELRTLRSNLTSIREQYADLEDSHSSLSRSSSQTMASQKSQVSTLTRQVALLTDEISQLRQTADTRSRTLTELQERYDEILNLNAGYANRDKEVENMSVVREELHRQAKYMKKLEATNAKLQAEVLVLREKQTSIEVLKEEKRTLERKVRVADELREKVVKLEGELEGSRKEREEWATKASEQSPSSSKVPVTVTQTLSELRLTYAKLLEENGANVALQRQRESEIKDAIAGEEAAKKVVKRLEGEVKALKGKVERREQRAVVAEHEVGFLQALVASYNTEEQLQAEPTATLTSSAASLQRIQQLETLVSEYKDANEKLSAEIDVLGADPQSSLGNGRSREALVKLIEEERKAKEDLEKELISAQSESETHLAKIDELEQNLFELSGEIAGGRHVPPGVRVLSMKDNPEQQWFDLRQEVMDRLKGENEALMKRLKGLEGQVQGPSQPRNADDSGVDVGNEELVPRESWELVNQEKLELEEVVKQKEKRLLRLQQVFSSKSAEFREAIASILGLKLAFYPNGQVRVTSVYDLSASFVFQPLSKSTTSKTPSVDGVKMQLVAQGEGGPQDLPNLMQYWIENEQCIPGFLASVTLECIDKSKREGTFGTAGG